MVMIIVFEPLGEMLVCFCRDTDNHHFVFFPRASRTAKESASVAASIPNAMRRENECDILLPIVNIVII